MRFSRKALSIDFGSKEIKVIEGKYKKGNIQIQKGFTIQTPSDCYINGNILNKEGLAKKLEYKLGESKIKTVNSRVIISSSDILIREIVIPKVSSEEIKGVVNYQIADYLPIKIEEYVVQYLNQGNVLEGEINKIRILLIAIPKNIVLGHMDLLKSAGLKPISLDYQGNAMAKLLKFNNTINDDYPIKDLVIASIDMGDHSSKITITKNSKIEITRMIDFGGKVIKNNIASFFEYSTEKIEEKLRSIRSLDIIQDDFTDEARLSNIIRSSFIDFCEKSEAVFKHYNTREVGNVIDMILLQGGLAKVANVDDVFTTYFNIPAIQLSTLDKIDWNKDLSTYANAIGGLIRMDVG